MVDLVALARLFFDVSRDWTEPKVEIVHPLGEVDNEPAFQKLKAEGHELGWRLVISIHRLKRQGWAPITERDSIGRPTIFMDQEKELILMHRPPKKEK
jgi:hypothetical protein